MIDPHGRPINYLRVSVTDRCDFRCVYCMSENMTFLPKADVLSLEEIDRLCSAFVGLGVKKLRLTGGEPLVRKNIMSLIRNLSRHAVALKGSNETEFDNMIKWCGDNGFDLPLIETMPMGEISGDRNDQYLPLSIVRSRLRKNWTLTDIDYQTGGPARYMRIEETGQRLGFITPLTHNFCESCNRVRLTCTGTLYMCLGQDDSADLRSPLRKSTDETALIEAINEAISRKPKGHDFVIDRKKNESFVPRHMNVTGG